MEKYFEAIINSSIERNPAHRKLEWSIENDQKGGEKKNVFEQI